MFVEATTHQKPSFKRVILFGARASERVISRHRYRRRATRTQKCARERNIHPIYLTTSTEPKPKRPRGLIANRRLLSSLLPCTHHVPIMYNRYMYLLGCSWELNRHRWHAPRCRVDYINERNLPPSAAMITIITLLKARRKIPDVNTQRYLKKKKKKIITAAQCKRQCEAILQPRCNQNPRVRE